jgi:4-amino-4-deoxy-L-arabinose transferase-like glycosyltransferase
MFTRSSRWPLAILALGLVLGLGTRIAVIGGKDVIGHDEAISYLAATCHEGDWDRVTSRALPPTATWATAADWRRFVTPKELLCFGRIDRDLADLDVHPPLYFWLLHVWVQAFGVGLRSGPLLNLPIFVAAALALFLLARRLLESELEAAVVVFVWALSPAVLPISGEARMYDLFALVSIVFVWQVVRLADGRRPSPLGLAGLGVTAACGLATQFSFLLVAGAGAVYLAVRLARSRPRWLLAALGAIVIGFLLLLALDPSFPKSFDVQQARGLEKFSSSGLRTRLDRTASGFAGFFVPDQLLSIRAAYAALALLAASAAACAVLLVRRGGLYLRGAAAIYFAAAIGGGIAILYVTFLTHGLAIGGKYLAACWPFLAFAPVMALRLLPRRRGLAAGLLCAAMLASGVVGALTFYGGDRQPPDPSRYLARSKRALVDTVRRGVLIPVVFQLRPREPVYAAPQPLLLRTRARWLPALRAGTSLYVSDTHYGDDRHQAQIRRAIRHGGYGIRRAGPSLRSAASAVFLVIPR